MSTTKKAGLACMKAPSPADLDKFVNAPAEATKDAGKGVVAPTPEKAPVAPVRASDAAPIDPEEPTQRLTIEIPLSLHVIIKSGVARRRTKIKDEVLALLEQHYRTEA